MKCKMTLKELLIQEIESAPESMLSETLTFLRTLKASQQPANRAEEFQESDSEPVLTGSTAQDLLQFLGTWEGDDFEECLKSVYETRSKTQF